MGYWTLKFTCLCITGSTSVMGSPYICYLQWTSTSVQMRLKTESKSMYFKEILELCETCSDKANLERMCEWGWFVISSYALPSGGLVRNGMSAAGLHGFVSERANTHSPPSQSCY